MEEILHQLIWQISHCLQGFLHVGWLAGFLPSTVLPLLGRSFGFCGTSFSVRGIVLTKATETFCLEDPGEIYHRYRSNLPVWDYINLHALPETNSSHLPGNVPKRKGSSSNHQFSGAMLVSGRVNNEEKLLQQLRWLEYSILYRVWIYFNWLGGYRIPSIV